MSHGLPQLTIPLPSRKELCRFTLRPVTQCVRDIVTQLQEEDRGIDRVIFSTSEGVRISSSTSIEALLTEDFSLTINDISYMVNVPHHYRITSEELKDMGDVRHVVNKLYSALNVDQHQLEKERDIVSQIEEIKSSLIPHERVLTSLIIKAEQKTSVMTWFFLGFMGLQFGLLARLTWWEYSWDIMEPVTYFVTYGTAIVAYAYYVVTSQDFVLPEVRDRNILLTLYKRARKAGMNVTEYNKLKDRLLFLETDLKRLRDPLAMNLPPSKLDYDTQNADGFSWAQNSLKNIFKFKRRK